MDEEVKLIVEKRTPSCNTLRNSGAGPLFNGGEDYGHLMSIDSKTFAKSNHGNVKKSGTSNKAKRLKKGEKKSKTQKLQKSSDQKPNTTNTATTVS